MVTPSRASISALKAGGSSVAQTELFPKAAIKESDVIESFKLSVQVMFELNLDLYIKHDTEKNIHGLSGQTLIVNKFSGGAYKGEQGA